MHLLALLIRVLLLAALPALSALAQVPPSALLVLHGAGHRLTLLDAWDGATLADRVLDEPVSGPPQTAADARHAYWGTDAGEVIQMALPGLATTARADVGVGPGTPLLALSGDGRWLLAAGARQAAVQILDAGLHPARRMAIATPDGRQHARATQVQALPASRSWLLALETLKELWEISYDPKAAPIFDGLVHDYRMGEALPRDGFLGVRRTPLPAPLSELLPVPGTRLVVGGEHCTPPVPCTLRLLHLDTRSQVAAFALPGTPRPGASAAWARDGHLWLALAGLDSASAPLELPRARPATTATAAELPAHTRRVLYVENPAALWLQRADGHWLRLDAQHLQPQAELSAEPNTRLLIVQGQPVLVTPGVQGSLSLRNPLTLRERLRLPFTELQGAWAVHPR